MSNPENQIRSETVLQRKVKKIAVAWFTIHLIGFVGEILSKTQKYGISESGQYWYESKSIVYMAIETSIGLISSICLFVGATKRNKYLLIPFMLVGAVTFVFLIGVSVMFILLLWSSGNPSAFIAIAFLLVLIFTQLWMLKTTQQYYKELNKKQGRDGVENLPCATDSALPATAPPRNDVLGQAPMNPGSGPTSFRFPSALNPNESFNSQPIPPELPPAYSDTVVVSRDSTNRGELPPSYDDAIAMKDKNIGGNLV